MTGPLGAFIGSWFWTPPLGHQSPKGPLFQVDLGAPDLRFGAWLCVVRPRLDELGFGGHCQR